VVSCQLPLQMAETAVKSGLISNLEKLVLYTIVHHSLTSTYTQNFIEIEETFCGRMDERTDI